MIEPARRRSSGHSSDAVRRLIARPIRMRTVQSEKVFRADPAPAPAEAAPQPIVETVKPAEEPKRQDTEFLILKAVLKAERRENASLRACLGFEDETLGTEARAVRNRWAALVDKLLHEPR